MNVLIDTPVWSAVMRRRAPEAVHVNQVQKLIRDKHVRLLGAVRQELLSGIRDTSQFERLRTYLRSFLDIQLQPDDYEQAAIFFNECRKHGVQGSNTDFLICAVAFRAGFSIYTLDDDFKEYARHIPVVFHTPK